jgi:hypothetical protein
VISHNAERRLITTAEGEENQSQMNADFADREKQNPSAFRFCSSLCPLWSIPSKEKASPELTGLAKLWWG